MIIVREITQWKTNTPNHIYKLSDDKRKMYSYTSEKTGITMDFEGGRTFSPSYRKFELLEKIEDVEKTSPTDKFYKVMGSNGNTYTVIESNGSLRCSCPGFGFRGKCKHTEKK